MRTPKKQSGFTLLEMIVSLGIFTVVAVFAVGALVRITALNRQAQTLYSSMNNVAFVLETMSREMRQGSNFDCESNNANTTTVFINQSIASNACPIIGLKMVQPPPYPTYIAFKSSYLDKDNPTCHLVYAYMFFDNGGGTWSLRKAQQSSCDAPLGPDDFHPVLDETNMKLTAFEVGVQPGSAGYSWAFIRLKGYAGVRVQDQNTFDIQTSISQRISD